MNSLLISAELFVYVALLFYVLGFLFRDELWLRGLLFIGTFFYILYYYFAADTPLWDAIITSGILGLVNIVMIGVVILERTTFAMNAETAELYSYFSNLSPGQFRRIMKRGQQQVSGEAQTLCREGETLDRLYFVVDGTVYITKGAKRSLVSDGSFVGEVAFLRGTPASATVDIGPGTTYVVWEHDVLRALMAKSPNLANALLAKFNMDLAGKVARSHPEDVKAQAYEGDARKLGS